MFDSANVLFVPLFPLMLAGLFLVAAGRIVAGVEDVNNVESTASENQPGVEQGIAPWRLCRSGRLLIHKTVRREAYGLQLPFYRQSEAETNGLDLAAQARGLGRYRIDSGK